MEAWWEITAKVNALGVAVRTEDDLKKKWRDFKLAVLNTVQDLKDGRCTAKELNYLPVVI